jgi:hypothetical protein
LNWLILRLALVHLRLVVRGLRGGGAEFVVFEAVGGVGQARRAGDGHRRNAGAGHRIALVTLAVDGGLGHFTLADEGQFGGLGQDGAGLAHGLVGQHQGRHLHGFRQMHGPLRGEQAVGHRVGGDHDVRRVAMQAVDRDVEVALLGLGGDAGGGTDAHHVHHHQRHFGGHGKAQRFDHQRQAGAGCCGHRRHAAVGGTDDLVDRGQFVFGLHQHAADLGQRRGEPFEDFGGRGDWVGGDETHTAANRAEAGGLVAGNAPARCAFSFDRRQARDRGQGLGGIDAGEKCGHAGFDCGGPLFL